MTLKGHNALWYANHEVLLVAWCSGNAFDPINEVIVRRARLVLRWVTA